MHVKIDGNGTKVLGQVTIRAVSTNQEKMSGLSVAVGQKRKQEDFLTALRKIVLHSRGRVGSIDVDVDLGPRNRASL